MNTTIGSIFQLFALALCVSVSTPSWAQLRVNSMNDVIVGSVTDTALGQQHIYSDQPHTLRLSNTMSSSSTKIGLFNQMSGADGQLDGIFNSLTSNSSTALTHGIQNSLFLASAAGIGLRNNLSGGGNTTQNSFGIFNYLAVGTDTAHYTARVYGIWNQVKGDYIDRSLYGTYNTLKPTDSIRNNFAGYFNVDPTSLPPSYTGNQYGVYATINGGNGYAGYFVGDVHVTGALTYTSDARLKENIRPVGSALDRVLQLQPKRYRFRPDPQRGQRGQSDHYGFLAEELESIFPELVTLIQHPAQTDDWSAESSTGEPGQSGRGERYPATSHKAINYTELITVLVKSIQEQQATIEALERRIEALERE